MAPEGRFSIRHLDDTQTNNTSVGLTDHLFRREDEITLRIASWTTQSVVMTVNRLRCLLPGKVNGSTKRASKALSAENPDPPASPGGSTLSN